MSTKIDKKKQINIMLNQRSRDHLAELQRILETRSGMRVSQGQAIAFALNKTLEIFTIHPEQNRLI